MQDEALKKRIIIVGAVIVLMLVGSIAAALIMKAEAKRERTSAYIYQNGELIKVVDLSEDSESYTITVSNSDGGYNVLEIRGKSIGVVKASCPDGLCMHMGFISDGLMPITCLPNHLVIQVRGNDNPDNMDGKVY